MSKRIHVGTSPLTNNIYAGHVLKDGRTWSDTNKTDVTHEAIGAVCEHAERFGKPITVNCNGEPKYRLIVERLSGKDSSQRPLGDDENPDEPNFRRLSCMNQEDSGNG